MLGSLKGQQERTCRKDASDIDRQALGRACLGEKHWGMAVLENIVNRHPNCCEFQVSQPVGRRSLERFPGQSVSGCPPGSFSQSVRIEKRTSNGETFLQGGEHPAEKRKTRLRLFRPEEKGCVFVVLDSVSGSFGSMTD